MIRISLMGSPVVEATNPAGRFDRLPLSCAERTLLSVITLRGEGRTICRDAIIDMMWPDVDPSKARSRLSSTLLRVRKTVNAPAQPDVIVTKDQRIGLTRDGRVTADLWEIETLCADMRRSQVGDWHPDDIKRLEEAVEARRGPFLDGIEGDWTDGARRQCADTWASLLGLLLRYYRYSRQSDGAIRIAKLILRQDPYREDIHSLLVQLYSDTGQYAKAHAQFAACANLLETELGVQPGPEVCAALSQAQQSPKTPEPHAPAAVDPISDAILALEETLATAQAQLDALKSQMVKPR